MKLYAGYWAGEFGWELMRWQAAVRHIAIEGAYNEIIIGCQHGHEFLYDDFATGFIYQDKNPIVLNMWLGDGKLMPIEGGDVRVFPTRDFCIAPQKSIWRCYWVDGTVRNNTILLHARNVTNNRTHQRNWPLEKWAPIIERYPEYDFVSIGSMTGASYIPGTRDARGMPLSDLARLMSEAKVFVSPSSGPAHFASLCGLPHVVWGGSEFQSVINMTNRERYEAHWNPLHTPVEYIESWQPDPYTVMERMERCLSLLS
jgi:hypothetical protein